MINRIYEVKHNYAEYYGVIAIDTLAWLTLKEAHHYSLVSWH